MFHFLKCKLRSKKWMNISLLLGMTLFVAVVSCHPMFLYGSLNKLLDMAFQDAIIANNKYPTVLSREGMYESTDGDFVAAVKNKLLEYQGKWQSHLGIDVLETQMRLVLSGGSSSGSYGSKNNYFNISYLEDMENHISIVKGEGLSEAVVPEGVYPCLISVSQMDAYGLICGETLTFSNIDNAKAAPLTLQIVGIVEEASSSDIYWYETLSEMSKQVFVSREVFEELIGEYQFQSVEFYYHAMLDYTEITGQNADDITYGVGELLASDQRMSENFVEILDDYTEDAKTVFTLLFVLELPMLILLLTFIYMVSGQILKMETGEIAMMKSRGISRMEIIKLYIEHSGLLSAIAAFFGIPAGLLLCKLTAGTDSFLVFRLKDTGNYRMVWQALPYAFAAAAAAMICMTIPVLGYSKLSIVQQKGADKKQRGKMFWETYFLDVICLVLSLYLLYNYNQQKDLLAWNVLTGEKLDPVIFMNSSFFMLASGLFVLRLIHYVVKLIYFVGRNRWSPAMYASFLQITRTFKKQGFISIFLVMTIAMGIFNSNMVRTINENEKERITYDIGTDVKFSEHWTLTTYKPLSGDDSEKVWLYSEPDFKRFYALVEDGICESVTKVILDDEAIVNANGVSETGVTLMGINTKEFGETATLKSGLNDTHWYYSLNALASNPNGVIISTNTASRFELSVGDTLSCDRISPLSADETMGSVSLSVVAIVDAWPSYNSISYVADENATLNKQENYLIVCNYAAMVNIFGQTPYDVWARLSDEKSALDVAAYLADAQISTETFYSIDESMEEMKNAPVIQITNGMYTLSFLIAVLLCLSGFLIYWITSIRQRQLLFGIYRAMGMHMHDIYRMLINEQIFSSMFAVAGGIGVGALATTLFVRLISTVYLPKEHNIALEIYTDAGDMVRLSVIIVLMFVICLTVLRRLLKHMNIALALKLGED